MEKINVFIADNQLLTRIGLSSIISEFFSSHVEIEQIENKENLNERLSLILPQILIIDFNLFNFNSIAEISELKKISPDTGILVITDNQSPDDILRVLDCGIINYILKTSSKQEIIEAVNATLSSRKYFSSEVLDVLLVRKSIPKQIKEPGRLTNSEIEVIKLIAQGLTTKKIADLKNLSIHTIISHRKNIFRKLGINNTSELLMYAMHAGLIDSAEYYI